MSYMLKHTAEAIDYKLDLIDENKNLLPYPYTTNLTNGLLPVGLDDVGDGSILTSTPADATETRFLLNTCSLHAGKYAVSLEVTNILEEAVTDSGFSLEIPGHDITNGLLDLSAETGAISVEVWLNVPTSFSANLLIKPQIEEGSEKTAWVPNMDKIGTYVDRRFNNTNAKIKVLAQQMDELEALINYKPITIISFTKTIPNYMELGSTITSVTFSWETNKIPTKLTLDGTSIDASSTSHTISGLNITSNKTWKLFATDEKDEEDEKPTSVTFCNNIYYGTGDRDSDFDSAFVNSLTKKLQTSKAYTFSVTPSTPKYIYYAVPTRLGTVSFVWDDSIPGGFEAAKTISVTNSSGYIEDYDVYRSTEMIDAKSDIAAK